jgi:hypothetical protein
MRSIPQTEEWVSRFVVLLRMLHRPTETSGLGCLDVDVGTARMPTQVDLSRVVTRPLRGSRRQRE